MAAKKASRKRHHFDPVYSQWHQRFPEFPGIECCLEIFRSTDDFRGNWQDVAWMEMSLNAEANIEEYISVAKREVARQGAHAYTVLWTLAYNPHPKCKELFQTLLDHPDEKFRKMAGQGLKNLSKRSK